MTASAATAPGRDYGAALRAIPLRPVEGWQSLLTTALMVVVVAMSLQDAGWTPNTNGQTEFLPWLALIGLAFGVIGAKVGWGRWRTHLVGALFAGIVLPLIMGGVVHPAGWDPHALAERLTAAVIVMRNVWTDLVVFGRPYTTEFAYYHLVFGAMVWGAGMLAGFTVFGHRRPLDAVVVLGLVLLGNIALTRHNGEYQLLLLVVFSAAALLLLIRTHVFEEELTWARRKIGDPASIGQLYLIAGAQFVIVAVLGAVLLTATASSAPLEGVFKDLPQRLQTVTQWLQRFAPPGGEFRGLGAVTFGDNANTTGQWQPSDRVAFRAQFPRTEDGQFKWRAGTYAEYTTFGWKWGQTRVEQTAANARLLEADVAGDKPSTADRRELTFHVIPDAFSGETILSPNTPVTVDRPTNALVIGTDGWFTTVESNDTGSSYDVSALVPVFSDDADGINQIELRAAGTDYPAELETIYTALPDGSMGDASTKLLQDIKAVVTAPSYADPANPYDLARTMESYLRDETHFKYQEDVRAERNAQCSGLSTVECFARMRVGYCDYYASTMTVLLRASGVPARVASGFLPGDRGDDGMEIVPAALAHYWVEVYFPGIGWIEFDPTGGGRGQSAPIPSGSPGPQTPRPSLQSAGPRTTAALPTFGTGGGTTTGGSNTGIGPFIGVGVILAVLLVALGLIALRRTPNKPMDPDKAWGAIARLAARVGLGPRPSQTVYEYAGVLGDAVPAARLELTTIARAKVEVAYGRGALETDRLHRIAIAYQRLRLAILGVVLRRVLRRRRRRN